MLAEDSMLNVCNLKSLIVSVTVVNPVNPVWGFLVGRVVLTLVPYFSSS